MTDFPPIVRGRIEADSVHIGKGAVIEEGVLITGKGGPCKRVHIGDFAYIGPNCKILAPEFIIGDYTKLNQDAFGHGTQPLRIGRNCWFGGNVILDCMGGLDIHDNVGVGAGSQLWTHAQFGDIVEGSRFYSHTGMSIGRDAWLVGHCLVSPVSIGERSMAMLGSVITSDMEPNHIYGGVPAKDLTAKLGPQFADRSVDEKVDAARKMVREFEARHPKHAERIVPVDSLPSSQDAAVTYLDLGNRTYTQRYSAAEVAFLKANVPLIKLTPVGKGPLF